MKVETVAAWEARLRPLLARLPPALAVRLYSRGRLTFHAAFVRRLPPETPGLGRPVPEGLSRTLWGLRFRSPLLNAAGMFKNGEGYEVVARQGAGAYLAGTTTHRPRPGNRRAGVVLPFAAYRRSAAASNWLGLPNPGHRAVAERLRGLERREGMPVGASVAADPDPALDEEEKLAELVRGMELYDRAGVDFLEMNESCPNTEEAAAARGPGGDLRQRLAHVAERFLVRRRRRLPVIVKFSCDTAPGQVPELMKLLVELGFDGVNFGNTSTDYARCREDISPVEASVYDYFIRTFGGGVSGRPLKAASLRLAALAVEHLRQDPPGRELHVVRTGGVEDAEDLRRSEAAGVALNGWYSGYFEAFGRHGHGVYRELYRRLAVTQ